jgi:hypothetical protein
MDHACSKEEPMAENTSFLATIALLFLITAYEFGSFAITQWA